MASKQIDNSHSLVFETQHYTTEIHYNPGLMSQSQAEAKVKTEIGKPKIHHLRGSGTLNGIEYSWKRGSRWDWVLEDDEEGDLAGDVVD